jgi:Cu-processing system permease protein
VRPLTRGTFLAGRFLAAAVVCMAYVVAVFLISVLITHAFVGWWPDATLVPALEMAAAVAVLVALALAGSVVLSSTANGIAIFMLFGAGLTAGLLGEIGDALSSHTLSNVAKVSSWVLPFEALYQQALADITKDTVGFTRLAIDLGPFGGAHTFGPALLPYAIAYVIGVGAFALWRFRRRDLS